MSLLKSKTVQRLSMALFIATVLWGTYTVVSYYGIPVHGAVLMEGGSEDKAVAGCESGEIICRGFAAMVPSIMHTLSRLAPFAPYLLICLTLYGLFIGWRAFVTGKVSFAVNMKPWHVYGLFIASVWLFFTTLSSGSMAQGDNMISFRRVIEPHPDVYTNVDTAGMTALRTYFDELLEGGCLEYRRDIRADIREFDMRTSCLQKHFITRVLSQVLFLTMIILVMLTAGRALLRLSRFSIRNVLTEAVLSFGLGACYWITLLWLISVIGLLQQVTGWLAIALTLMVFYIDARYWLLTFFTHRWHVDRKWYGLTVICAWLLISYLAFNFLTVVRPFPIGWDDLGSYLNRPRQLVSFGKFMYFMSPFQWEYMTSFAYLLYGLESIYGSTAAMMINWMAGLLAVSTILVFASAFFGPGGGILAALTYYTLPMVGHFSFADMKTDNAVFAFQALSIFCLFVALFSSELHDSEEDEDEVRGPPDWSTCWKWIFLSGLFCGFAFGTKATAIMIFMSLAMMLMGVLLHPLAGLGVVFLSLFVFVVNGALHVDQVFGRVGMEGVSRSGFISVAVTLGLICLAYATFKNTRRVHNALAAGFILVLGFAAAVGPWILHNNILRGNIIPRLELSAPNTITPYFDTDGTYAGQSDFEGRTIRSLPPELQIDKSHPLCKSSSREEELGRYWGYREGWTHYLTLPWRSVMNIDSAGYYVTTAPALLLFPLLLLLPFFWRKNSRWIRWLFVATAYMLVQWMFMANGVVWYGIGIFFGLSICIEALLRRAPDVPNRAFVSALVFLSLVSCFAMRSWQFEQQRNLLEYPMGKSSASTLRQRTIPYYDNIANTAVQRHETIKDRPYLYRVGTFIPYFIPRNLEIIAINDHQLDFFNCLHQERDSQKTLARLKALGFNSMIFDTNTATIEKNPNGTLHKKVQAFVDFLNDPTTGLQVVLNKPNAGVVFILIP